MNFTKNKQLNYVIVIALICSISYLSVYMARTMLSAVTPQLVESGNATNEYVGAISSAFFLCYAIGQLLNGIIGEKIGGKYMVSIGLVFSAAVNFLFLIFIMHQLLATVLYGLFGFCLSMVYAPMVKIISENMKLLYAEKCNLALQTAALLGSPAAGIMAGFFAWKNSLMISSILLFVMGILYYVIISELEKKKIIVVSTKERKKTECKNNIEHKDVKRGIKILIRRGIIPFTFIAGLTGIVRTSVVFWMPAYISQYLRFNVKEAAFIYTFATLVISMAPFATMFIFRLLHRKVRTIIFLQFGLSCLAFLATYFVENSYLNILFFILAVITSNTVSSIIWIIYCPGLYDTGMVSTATGYLDFISYLSGAFANIIFANAVVDIGWKNLILIWMLLVGCGMLTGLSKKIERKN